MTHPAPSMLHHRHPHKCTDSPNQSSSASACTHASPSSGPDSHGHQPGSTPAPSFTQLARAVASGQPGLSLAALGQTLLGVAVWTVSLAQENLVATAYAYWLAFHAQSLAIVAVQRAVRTHQVLGGLPPSTPCPPHSWPLFPVAGPRPVFKHPSELDHSTRWSSSPLVPDQEKVMIPGDSGTPITAAKSAGLYPFGWRRLPVILTLAQLLYLFFVAAHTITESIEHLASSGSHDANTETRFLEGIGLALPINDRYHGPVLTLLAALTTIGTALAFRVDHLLTADGASSLPNLAWHSPVTASPFVWRLLGVAGMVLGQPRLVQRYPQHHVDVYLALGTAAIMVSTALPHLLRVSTLLLQASPAPTSRQVEQHLAEICSWPNVSGYNHLCLWANAPDEVYCSVEITIEALEQAQDESALLARIVAHLAPCVQHLTVQLNSSDQPRGAQYTS